MPVQQGVIPIIQCPPNGMAEHVARAVDKKLREHLLQGGGDSGSTLLSFQRPVLVLMDRTVDLSVMLHHPWTYQAMVQDLLKAQLNRVWFTPTKKDESTDSVVSEVVYELEEDLDEFWAEHRYSQFPQMAEAVHVRISELKKRKEQLTKTIGEGVEGEDLRRQLADNTQSLRQMATSLPQLQEQKKFIDMHLALATGILHMINDRDLNVYVTLENSIMQSLSQDKSEVLQVLQQNKGTAEDKLRLYLIYYLHREAITAAEAEEIESKLSSDTPFLAASAFVKK